MEILSALSAQMGGLALVIGTIGILIVFYLVVRAVLRLYRKVGPNRALIVYGRKGTRVVTGGGTIVWGAFERAEELDLSIMTISVKKDDVRAADFLSLYVDWTAQVQIGKSEKLITTAASAFLGQSQDVIQQKARETLLGNVRGIIATLTSTQLNSDREEFVRRIREQVADEMSAMGLEVVSLTLENIWDENGYFHALAAKELALVKRDQAIAEADANRETREKKSAAELAAKQAEIDAETKQADAQRELDMKKAANLKAVNVAKAEAVMAEKSRQAELQNALTVQEMAVQITREQEMAKVAEQAAARKERELQTEVIRPAQAEAQKLELDATAQANATRAKAKGQADASITAAQAQRDQLAAIAEGKKAELIAQAEGTRATLLAQAEGNKATLLAEAEGQRASLFAEAEGKAELAKALNAMNEASLTQTQALALIEALPAIAQAYASSMSNIGDVKIVDMGGSTAGDSPMVRFAQTGPKAAVQLMESLGAMTGVDLTKLLSKFVNGDEAAA